MPVGNLHVITEVLLQDRFSHVELTKMAIAGGADTIQFRQKEGSTRGMIEAARGMREVCKAAGVLFIVNDRIDVALAVDADGVHLGQDDFPIPLARQILGPGKIIGGSASDLQDVQTCLAERVDYIGFGPVYRTTSKDDAGAPGGVPLLEEAVQAASVPIIAIGGIGAGNLAPIMRAGAAGIAVISAVCCRDDPEGATRALRRGLKEALSGG